MSLSPTTALSLVIVLIVTAGSSASAQLVNLKLPATPLRAQFLDATTGYILTLASQCGMSVEKRLLYRTTDGGNSWENLSGCDSNRMRRIREFQMLDTLRGFASIDPRTGSRIWFVRTIDGGRSWIDVDTNGTSFHFLDSLEGFRHAYKSFNEPRLMLTTNAGSTWAVADTTIVNSWALQFPTPNVGYGLIWGRATRGDHGARLARTTDRGRSWKALSLAQFSKGDTTAQSDFTLYRPTFPSAAIGYGFSQGSIFRTMDSGTTWTKLGRSWESAIDAKMPIEYRHLHFIDDTTGYLAGVCYDFGDDMALGKTFVVRTNDGGASWTALRHNGKRNMPDVYQATIHAPVPGVAYIRTDEVAGRNRLYKSECVEAVSGFMTAGPLLFKEGDSATIVAREGSTYEWTTGETTRAIKVRYSGRYGVRIMLPNHCAIYDTMIVTVAPMVRATGLVQRECTMDCAGATVNPAVARAAINGFCDDRVTVRQYLLPSLQEALLSEVTGWKDPSVRGSAIDDSRATYMLVQIDTFTARLVKLAPTVSVAWSEEFVMMPLAGSYFLELDHANRPVVALSQWSPQHQAYSSTVVRFTADGAVDYRHAYQHEVLSTVLPAALLIADDNAVLVPVTMSGDVFILEYAPDGTPVAPRRYSYSDKSFDIATGLSLAPNGDAIITAMSYTDRDSFAVVAAIRRDGSVRWQSAERVARFSSSRPHATGLADGGAIVVMHGSKYSPDTLTPSVTRVAVDGGVIWRRRLASDTSDYQALRHLDRVSASYVDEGGNTYVSGAAPPYAYWTMQFDADGNKRWEILTDLEGTPQKIVPDANGALYIAVERGVLSGCMLQRLEQAEYVSTVRPEWEASPESPTLRVHPIPATDLLSLHFLMLEAGEVAISLFDAGGRRVIQLAPRLQAAGDARRDISTRELTSGVYLVRVEAGQVVHTAPVVVSRDSR